MAITYNELGEAIGRMNDEQRRSNVTIHLQSVDEFFPVDHCELNDADQEDDRLDDGHPILVVFDSTETPSLERRMQIAFDTKKDFLFSKDEGVWRWANRGGPGVYNRIHGPFPSFEAALNDAVEPYLENEGT